MATDGQSVSKSWCRAPSRTHDQIFSYYYLTVTVLFLWVALSDERTGLSFVYAAGSSQRSLSRVRVPWYSRPYFTVSDLRLPISSPLTTHRVTVEVFDPASTLVTNLNYNRSSLCRLRTDNRENISHVITSQRVYWLADCCLATSYNIRPLRHIFHCCTLKVFTEPLPRNALSKSVTICMS
jgi:hypothetical protein